MDKSSQTSSGEGQSEEKQELTAQEKKKQEKKKRFFVILVIAVALIGGCYLYLIRNEVDTDDAFTAGRSIMVAPHVGGYVTQLRVNDNQFVREGQILAVIDQRDWQAQKNRAEAALDQAKSAFQMQGFIHQIALLEYPGQFEEAQGKLEQARADLFRAQTDYGRQHRVIREATSQQNLDYAKAQLEAAKGRLLSATGSYHRAQPVDPNIGTSSERVSQEQANLVSAQANLQLAQLNVEWTVIRAPHDGWISQRNVEQGTFVHAGQNLFSIVEPEVWVTANFKETQITKMLPGQKVDIYVDAFPQLKLHGHIDSIQKGTGATFSAFPPENATGNYVKIVQRVPIKIMIDEGLDRRHPLSLGLSVEPVVHVDTPGRSDAPPQGVPTNGAQGIL